MIRRHLVVGCGQTVGRLGGTLRRKGGRKPGTHAANTGPRFQGRSARRAADTGPTDGFPLFPDFRRPANSDSGTPAGNRADGYTSLRRRVPQRRGRLLRREFRPNTRYGNRGLWRPSGAGVFEATCSTCGRFRADRWVDYFLREIRGSRKLRIRASGKNELGRFTTSRRCVPRLP